MFLFDCSFKTVSPPACRGVCLSRLRICQHKLLSVTALLASLLSPRRRIDCVGFSICQRLAVIFLPFGRAVSVNPRQPVGFTGTSWTHKSFIFRATDGARALSKIEVFRIYIYILIQDFCRVNQLILLHERHMRDDLVEHRRNFEQRFFVTCLTYRKWRHHISRKSKVQHLVVTRPIIRMHMVWV